MKHSFGSDNHSGVHPVIMDAIVKENAKFKKSYGEDDYTLGVLKSIEDSLGGDCTAVFVFNGTGANVVALQSFVKSYHSILAPKTAHINVDECGAVEKLSQSRIIPIKCTGGKVTAEDVKSELYGYGDQHHAQPRILSISQPTELGTCYTTDEIQQLADLMHSNGGYLHIDGSRISNAAAFMQKSIKEITVDCGADVLSFGGTKNGLLMGEAVVIFHHSDSSDKDSNGLPLNLQNLEAAKSVKYLRKQTTQLFSKSRFIAAQFEAYLKDDFNLNLANMSNSMAQYLAKSLNGIKDITISQNVESNAVFAIIPRWLTEELQKKHYFYVWDEKTNEVRWMCSFNTTKEDIDIFVNDIKTLTSQKG